MDYKLRENIYILLLRDKQNRFITCSESSEADFICYPVREYARYNKVYTNIHGKSLKHIVLDCEDRGYEEIVEETDWWPDRFLRDHNRNNEYIVFKLQFKSLDFITRWPFTNITVLSIPLLLGGSRFHITDQIDNEGLNIFSGNLDPVGIKDSYQYKWSFINSAAPARKPIISLLNQFKDHFRSGEYHFTVSQGSHSDANIATINYYEALRIHRDSQVNISTNGGAYWCLKDGELFTQASFILRQYHPNLQLNSLTPQDDKEWVIFTENNFIEKLDYYINHPQECKQIARAGYNYWSRGITGIWATTYADKICDYLENKNKDTLSGILIA